MLNYSQTNRKHYMNKYKAVTTFTLKLTVTFLRQPHIPHNFKESVLFYLIFLENKSISWNCKA